MDGAAIVSYEKVTLNDSHHLNVRFIVYSKMSKTLLIFCDGTGMDGNLSEHSKEMIFCLSYHLTGWIPDFVPQSIKGGVNAVRENTGQQIDPHPSYRKLTALNVLLQIFQ
jgi:hypothetical protein